MAIAILLALVASVVWLGLFGLGVVVTWRGVRGQVVDRAARCAKCRYNVSAGGVRPSRCPECGANLHELGSIRLGLRRARPPLIAVGALLILASLAPTGLLVGLAKPAAAPPALAVAQTSSGPRVTTPAQDALSRKLRMEAVLKRRPGLASVPTSASTFLSTRRQSVACPDEWTPPSALDIARARAPADDILRREVIRQFGGPTGPTTGMIDYEPLAGAPTTAAPSDAEYESALDDGAITIDFGSEAMLFEPEHRLIRGGFPNPTATGALRAGSFETWLDTGLLGSPGSGGAWTGPQRLPSTRIPPSYTGMTRGLAPLGSSPVPSISTGPTGAAAPTAAIPIGPKRSPVR